MYRQINGVGVVISSLPKYGLLLELPANLASQFADFAEDDYTYLVIGCAPNIEIVKAVPLTDVDVQLTRAQGGTSRKAHPTGTPISTGITYPAIVDKVNAELEPLYFSLSVNGGLTSNMGTIEYIDPVFQTAPDIAVLGELPKLRIAPVTLADNCCG